MSTSDNLNFKNHINIIISDVSRGASERDRSIALDCLNFLNAINANRPLESMKRIPIFSKNGGLFVINMKSNDHRKLKSLRGFNGKVFIFRDIQSKKLIVTDDLIYILSEIIFWDIISKYTKSKQYICNQLVDFDSMTPDYTEEYTIINCTSKEHSIESLKKIDVVYR